MIRLTVAGAAGRMGKTILSLALRDSDFEIAGALEHPESPALGQDVGALTGREPVGVQVSHDPDRALRGSDVLIDFTHPSATPLHLKAVLKAKTSYILGTTGLNEKIFRLLRGASKRIAIVQSPNMSIGVNLLFKLAETAGIALDASYDIEISEIHHRMKKDAPSGTAVKLLEILAAVRGKNPKKDADFALGTYAGFSDPAINRIFLRVFRKMPLYFFACITSILL
jgi:4-hydroxy-tetrahydrodipicolinate reductase